MNETLSDTVVQAILLCLIGGVLLGWVLMVRWHCRDCDERLRRAKKGGIEDWYEQKPLLEEWPMPPDQSHLLEGDFVKRDGEDILSVPLGDCTHIVSHTLNGVAYVRKI
jgi:hypothetical protein